jgi:hypothetical protein
MQHATQIRLTGRFENAVFPVYESLSDRMGEVGRPSHLKTMLNFSKRGV